MSNRPTNPHRRPARLVLYTNRLEDRIPGRAAFVVHRGRTIGRTRTLDGMRLLEEWARRRAERLAANGPATERSSDIDLTDRADGDSGADDEVTADAASDDERLAETATPDDSWTKGRIYELARSLDLEGRSKLNKADLLEAVLDELDERGALDGPVDPVYAEPRTPVETTT
ncbi:MAG: hypothetical protein RIB98_18460 [Acidimicrobiales bacterium]